MKKNIVFTSIIAGLLVISISSCTKKLDLLPTNDITAETVYSTAKGYKQALAKVYSAFALTGNNVTGSPDIPPQIISDEGNSDFLRLYFNLQELTTDEAAWTWQNDAGVRGLKEMSWSAINPIVNGVYYRSFFQITLCNDFIRQAADDQLATRGITGASADSIRKYKAEARFLRAYQYWVLMDLYGNPPFVTEADGIGTSIPKQTTRAELFAYIEKELKALETELVAPKQNEFARADQAAAWALLARLYLNAEVYIGAPKYSEAITYCNKLIPLFTLHSNYRELMLADNHLITNEFIFVIAYDGAFTQNWGGTTYLTHGPAAVPGSISGTSGNWGGLRHPHTFTDLFTDPSGNTDKRAQFYTTGQSKTMTNLYTGTDGYSSTKYRNKTRSGGPAPHADMAGNWVDIDFPLFRLAEIYFIYAESVLKGGTGGDAATALTYMNRIRGRAYANDPASTTGNITAAQLTLQYILDERARELYYEAHRRTDLIRHGKFTTNAYLWAWKGGVLGGTSVDSKYNLFPLPNTDLASNPNLKQNAGY
ncbi:MAG: RagB/SusD family nutrient uptake outer membrane protein [Bacteroidota bacterium]